MHTEAWKFPWINPDSEQEDRLVILGHFDVHPKFSTRENHVVFERTLSNSRLLRSVISATLKEISVDMDHLAASATKLTWWSIERWFLLN